MKHAVDGKQNQVENLEKISIGMFILIGFEWKYACFGLKPAGIVFVLMFILNGFEWSTVQQIVGTMFKPFLLSIS
jgi:hypothetical protein